jgi:tetratricopeptide (TPR) repeat protein
MDANIMLSAHPTPPTFSLSLDDSTDAALNMHFQLLEDCNPASIPRTELHHAATFIHFAKMSQDPSHIKYYLELANSICQLDLHSTRALGFYYLHENNHTEALKLFDYYLNNYDVDKTNVPTNDIASSYFYRGICHYHAKNFDRAKEDFLIGMQTDLQGTCLKEKTKKTVASYIAKLEALDLQKQGLTPDDQSNHLERAQQLQQQKKYQESLRHINQAIFQTPLKAMLYHTRCELYQQLMTDPDDTPTLVKATESHLFASWLTLTKVDNTNTQEIKITPTEAKLMTDTIIEHAREKKALRELTIDLRPINAKVQACLPKLNPGMIPPIVTALFNLYQNNTDQITPSECERILEILQSPTEIPISYIKALDKRINTLRKQKKYYQIVQLFDHAISHYPRFHTLYVQRARYFMMQSILVTNREQPLTDLDFALWLHRSGLDKCVTTLIPYYEQRRAYFLCNGECEKSQLEHQNILKLLPENKREITNKEYVASINEMFKVNPNLFWEYPEGVLKWLNLSYQIIPDPKVKEKINEIQIKLAGAASSTATSAPTKKQQPKKAKTKTESNASESQAASASTATINEKQSDTNEPISKSFNLPTDKHTSEPTEIPATSTNESKHEHPTTFHEYDFTEEASPTVADINLRIEQQEANEKNQWQTVNRSHEKLPKDDKKTHRNTIPEMASKQKAHQQPKHQIASRHDAKANREKLSGIVSMPLGQPPLATKIAPAQEKLTATKTNTSSTQNAWFKPSRSSSALNNPTPPITIVDTSAQSTTQLSTKTEPQSVTKQALEPAQTDSSKPSNEGNAIGHTKVKLPLTIQIDENPEDNQIASPIPYESVQKEKVEPIKHLTSQDLQHNIIEMLKSQQKTINILQETINRQAALIDQQKKEIETLTLTNATSTALLYQAYVNSMQTLTLQASNASYAPNQPQMTGATYQTTPFYYAQLQPMHQYQPNTFAYQQAMQQSTLTTYPTFFTAQPQSQAASSMLHQSTTQHANNRYRFQPNNSQPTHRPLAITDNAHQNATTTNVFHKK